MEEIIEHPTKKYQVETLAQVIPMEFDLLTEFASQTSYLYTESREKMFKTIEEVEDEENAPFMRRHLMNNINSLERMDQILFSSAFVSAVALYEVFLKDICQILVDTSKITPDEIEGDSYTKKSKTFLSKVVGIDLSAEEENWKKLMKYAEVRNKIVHDLGRIKRHINQPLDQQPQLYRFLAGIREVTIIEGTTGIDQFFITDANFITTYTTLAEEYLQFVVAMVREKIITSGL